MYAWSQMRNPVNPKGTNAKSISRMLRAGLSQRKMIGAAKSDRRIVSAQINKEPQSECQKRIVLSQMGLNR